MALTLNNLHRRVIKMMLKSYSSRFHLTATLALAPFIIMISKGISVPSVPADILENEMIRVVNDGFTITKEDKDYFSKLNSGSRLVHLEPNENSQDLRIVAGTEAKLGNTQ